MLNNQKGFTLIELMVVVVIIGILAAIALPNFLSMQDRAKESEVKANVHTVQLAVEDFKTQNNGVKPTNFVTAPAAMVSAGVLAADGTSGSCVVPATIKNPFTSVTGSAIIVAEGLASPLPATAVFGGVSGMTQGNIGYTGAIGGVPGNPYVITGTGKLTAGVVKYVAVTSEGQ